MIGNCLTFLSDLIATVIALSSPLYNNVCEKSHWQSKEDDC